MDFANPANPASPLSPLNPSNPISPLNPANWPDSDGDLSTAASVMIIAAFAAVVLLIVGWVALR